MAGQGVKGPDVGPNSILSHAPGWLAGWLAWLAGWWSAGQGASGVGGLAVGPNWLAGLAGLSGQKVWGRVARHAARSKDSGKHALA